MQTLRSLNASESQDIKLLSKMLILLEKGQPITEEKEKYTKFMMKQEQQKQKHLVKQMEQK